MTIETALKRYLTELTPTKKAVQHVGLGKAEL
jgi:hypothetical protein